MIDGELPTTTAAPAGVVLLGLMSGKPHAARFTPEEAALAEKAASLMGLSVLPLTEPDQLRAAQSLPAGRIFGTSGKGFVPFCKRETFLQLCKLGGIDPQVQLQAQTQPDLDAADAPAPVPTRLPTGWSDLGPGCLVLATEGEGHGWYPSIVLEEVGNALLMRWRDFSESEWPRFTRRPDQLALLPPGREGEPQAAA